MDIVVYKTIVSEQTTIAKTKGARTMFASLGTENKKDERTLFIIQSKYFINMLMYL